MIYTNLMCIPTLMITKKIIQDATVAYYMSGHYIY